MTRCDVLRAVCLLWLGIGLVLAGAHLWILLPPVIAYVVLAGDGALRPGSGWLMPVIRHGDRDNPLVALSFDDGPDAALTPLVLDALQRHKARATFFIIGRHAETHPELIRRMVNEGHEIVNHSYHHSRFLNVRFHKAMREEILRGVQALKRLSPDVSPTLYRPPMGLKNPALASLQKRMGLRVVAWSLHARDTHGHTAGKIAGRVLRRIRAGDIVVFHDGHDLDGKQRDMALIQALDLILPVLSQRGLQPITVSEIIGDKAAPVLVTSRS
ncbi:MAG: polysaccharide deacetylase family protein [Gammaproteobacteria bacterium]